MQSTHEPWLDPRTREARAVALAREGAISAALASLGRIRNADDQRALAAVAAATSPEELVGPLARLAVAGGDPELLGLLALTRARLGELGAAVRTLRGLIARGHTRWMRSLGEIALVHLDAPGVAVGALEAYLADVPDDTVAWLRLVAARAGLGDVTGARDALATARTLGVPAEWRAAADQAEVALAGPIATRETSPIFAVPPMVGVELETAAARLSALAGAAAVGPAVVTATGVVLVCADAGDVLAATGAPPPWPALGVDVGGHPVWLAALDLDDVPADARAWPTAPTPLPAGAGTRTFRHDGTSAPAWLPDLLDVLTRDEGIVPGWWPRQGEGMVTTWTASQRAEASAWMVRLAADHDQRLAALAPWLPETVAITRRALAMRVAWRRRALSGAGS